MTTTVAAPADSARRADVGSRRRRPAVGARDVRRSGARYVRRDVHDHAKAGDIDHAPGPDGEGRTLPRIDIHPHVGTGATCRFTTFLTATLGWFRRRRGGASSAPQFLLQRQASSTTTAWRANQACSSMCGDSPRATCRARARYRRRLLDVAVAGRACGKVGGVATRPSPKTCTPPRVHPGAAGKRSHHRPWLWGWRQPLQDQYLLQRRRWGSGSCGSPVHGKLSATKKLEVSQRNSRGFLDGTS